MSKDDNLEEKKLFFRYVLSKYHEQLQLAKTENKPTRINIDYPLLNEYYKRETGKEFLTDNYEMFMKYVENRINNGRTERNYITLKLVEIPPNVLLHDLDTTYNGELIAKAGETITSVLDKIKNMLGNFEYFYDVDGRFIFQE